MTLRQEREEELSDVAYAQGHHEGFREGKKKALEVLAQLISEKPWPYIQRGQVYQIIDIGELTDKIHDAKP